MKLNNCKTTGQCPPGCQCKGKFGCNCARSAFRGRARLPMKPTLTCNIHTKSCDVEEGDCCTDIDCDLCTVELDQIRYKETTMTDTRYDRRHELHIEIASSTSKRCHHVTTYTVTSRREISPETFADLRKAGFFSSGQSWRVGPAVKREMAYTPEGVDWAGRPYIPVSLPYFEYTVVNECDSGD